MRVRVSMQNKTSGNECAMSMPPARPSCPRFGCQAADEVAGPAADSPTHRLTAVQQGEHQPAPLRARCGQARRGSPSRSQRRRRIGVVRDPSHASDIGTVKGLVRNGRGGRRLVHVQKAAGAKRPGTPRSPPARRRSRPAALFAPRARGRRRTSSFGRPLSGRRPICGGPNSPTSAPP